MNKHYCELTIRNKTWVCLAPESC